MKPAPKIRLCKICNWGNTKDGYYNPKYCAKGFHKKAIGLCHPDAPYEIIDGKTIKYKESEDYRNTQMNKLLQGKH